MVHLSIQRCICSPVCAFLLVIMALVTSATLGTSASAAVVSTGSVLRSAKAAIAVQTSVHVVFIAHSRASSTTEKIVADVGTTSGSETLFEGKADLAIKVTPAHAYVTGNSSGLTTLFGLSAPQAKKLGTAWESWNAGTSQYSNLKTDLTMSSVTALLPKAKGTKVSTKTTNGVKLFELQWTIASTSSMPQLSNRLTVSAQGDNLPVEEVATASGGVRATTTLSKWGEDFRVSTPPAASTIASPEISG
jgi:hypothetical protein